MGFGAEPKYSFPLFTGRVYKQCQKDSKNSGIRNQESKFICFSFFVFVFEFLFEFLFLYYCCYDSWLWLKLTRVTSQKARARNQIWDQVYN